MDKKPTIATLKNDIDKLKTVFENDKGEKDTKINHILSVVEDLGTTLNSYSNGNVENGGEDSSVYGNRLDEIQDDIEQMKGVIKTEQLENQQLEKQIENKLKRIFEEELRKRDVMWQQKFDLMAHEVTKKIEGVKLSQNLQNSPPQTYNVKDGNKKLIIKFAPLSPHAQKPSRGSEHSAGIDLRSAYEYIVPAHGNKLIVTDWKVQYPEGYFGKICSRSGLSLNNHIEVGAGVVDADWTGSVNIVLNNLSDREFLVSPGDRVAQLVCTPYITPKIVYCQPSEILDTARGTNGFGSTFKYSFNSSFRIINIFNCQHIVN